MINILRVKSHGMGILGLGDAFSSRYPTIQVFARDGTWHVIPLKKITDTLVMVSIRGHVYPFLLDARAMKTYRNKGGKTVQTILYSLEDSIPLDTAALVKLRDNAENSGVRKIDRDAAIVLMRATELLSEKEEDVISLEEVKQDMISKGEEVGNVFTDFQAKTGLIKIVRPLPEITEYLTERLMVSPSMFSSGLLEMRQTNFEFRKIGNPAKTPFGHWLLVAGILMIVGVIGTAVYMGFEEGWFTGGVSTSLQDIFEMQKLFPDGPPSGFDAAVQFPDPGTPTPPAPTETTNLPDIGELRDLIMSLRDDQPPVPAPLPAANDTNPEPVQELPEPAPVVPTRETPTIVGGPTEFREAAYVEPMAVQCGFGTVLHDGVCEVDWGRTGPPIHVPEPVLPEWHPGTLSDTEKTLSEYHDYRTRNG